MLNCRFKKLAGNAEKYSVINVPPLAQSPIKGKHILYLGSSVTYGWASLSVSFVEYISKRNGTTFVKEAVGGTTLAATDSGDFSYVNRLKNSIKALNSIYLSASFLQTTQCKTYRSAISTVQTRLRFAAQSILL